MKPMLHILRHMLAERRRSFAIGAALTLTVLLMGAGLIGLSGWFITATAAAGLAGVGATFDVFRPSASVRFLAIGRTVARYGERLTTHDATLQVLAGLRASLLATLSGAPFEDLQRLRRGTGLNRLVADVDALDGIPLRLILPIWGMFSAHAVAFAVLWWLVDLRVALAVLLVYILGASATFGFAALRARAPSAASERSAQALRARLLEMIRTRNDLLVYGRLAREADLARINHAERRALQAELDRQGRQAGTAIALVSTLAATLALWIGLTLVQGGVLTPALAALGFFTALGLGETITPMHRAATEIGRMTLAAGRIAPDLRAPVAPDEPQPVTDTAPGAKPLEINALTYRREGAEAPVFTGFSLDVAPGEVVALTGPSGSGKSTLLAIAAGLLTPSAGHVHLLGRDIADWSETDLRRNVTLVPQRSQLITGTLAENLRVAAPEAEDAALLAAADTAQLTPLIESRDGLDMLIGPGGEGLSGGQARRVVLARALLRQPRLLLLDEPTEGLDHATAEALLNKLRTALPQTGVLIAAHRRVEIDSADRVVGLAGHS